MAGEIKKSINIAYKATTTDLETKLKKLPGVSAKEARKMVRELDKSFKKAEKSAAKSARTTAKSWKKATKGMASRTTGATASVGAIFSLGRRMADLTNELSDASTKTGIQTESLAALKLAAEGSGLSFSTLERGLIKLPASMQAAATGTGAAAEAFKRLGVDAGETGNLREADEVFNDLTKSLAEIPSGAERSALAMDIFGATAGQALIQSGALSSMQQFTDLSREYGKSTGPAATQAAADFQRSMADL